MTEIIENETKESKNIEIEKKEIDKLSDDDIKWRSKYKMTKSEYEEAKLLAEKEKSELLNRVNSTQKESQLLQEKLIQAELKAQAAAAGIKDLDFIKLIDTSELKLNDNGSVEGIEKVLTEFKNKKPDLFGTDKKLHSSTNAPSGHSDENKTSRLNARNLTKEDWKKNQRKYMSGNFS